jgi:hypothetical protein
MRQVKIFGFAVTAVICILLMALGCADHDEDTIQTKVKPQEQKPTVKPALKSAPADRITYKVTTDRERGVIWEGPLKNKPKSFVGGHSGNKIEMTFTRQTKSVDAEGSAVVKITINALKYSAKVRDKIVLDFDSSRKEEQDNPLSKLIGQSYTIELTASGEVSKVIDANDARAAVAGSGISNARATQLLSTQAITEQHSIPALPDVDNGQLIPGKTWSDIKTFSFGPMGAKSFERIYEIKQIIETDGRRIVIVQMNAVPSTAKAKEFYKEQSTGVFSSMFDNTETYTGRLRLDLTSGQIEKYTEEFRSDWVAVDPLATKQETEPDMLRMSATRIHRIERGLELRQKSNIIKRKVYQHSPSGIHIPRYTYINRTVDEKKPFTKRGLELRQKSNIIRRKVYQHSPSGIHIPRYIYINRAVDGKKPFTTGYELFTVDWQDGKPLEYKFVASREIIIDWDPTGRLTKSDNTTPDKSFETMEMVITYTPVEINPYGLTTIEAACKSVKVTRSKGPNTDAAEYLAGKTYKFTVGPTGKIADHSQLDKLLKEAGKKAFITNPDGDRIKQTDMIGDFIATQWFLWDSISSLENPSRGVAAGQTWISKLSIPSPMVMRKAREVTYKLNEIRTSEKGRLAVIGSSYKLADSVPTSWPIPYSGRFQMKGTFGFLSGYKILNLQGSGQELFNIETGQTEQYNQQYEMELESSIPMGIDVKPRITIKQNLTMKLLK